MECKCGISKRKRGGRLYLRPYGGRGLYLRPYSKGRVLYLRPYSRGRGLSFVKKQNRKKYLIKRVDKTKKY